MKNKVYVYDPTASDKLSAVRGIGRYLTTLRQVLDGAATFTSALGEVPYEGTFVHPFYNFLSKPLTYKQIARRQVAVIHDIIPLKYSRKFPAGIRGNLNIVANSFLLKAYDAIITDSEASKRDIQRLLRVDGSRISVAYPPLSSTFLTSASRHGKGDLPSSVKLPASGYCIYVGDATWNKNLINMAMALKTANIPCVFVGKVFEKRLGGSTSHPWMDELREFIRITLGDRRFLFPGYVTDDQLAALYKGATLNLLVSRDEGFGYSFAEAAACGTPSVLADRDIFHETAQESALFADPEDPSDIAAAVSKLFNSPSLRRNLGVLAKKRIGYFSPERFGQTLSDLLYND